MRPTATAPRMRRRTRWVRGLPLILTLILAVAIAGCGTKQVTVTGANGQATTETVKNIHFANTKFLFHMGLAYYVFHHDIVNPLRRGALSPGAPHRLRALLHAGIAGAFIVHELHVAREDAQSSNQLRPLLVKLDNAESRLAALIPGLRHGTASTTAISGAAGSADQLSSASSGVGLPIKDIAHTL